MTEIKKTKLEPGLYIISTPIGNLDDITIRALNVLNSADLILCENTINSLKLLSHYNIKTKLGSYNDHSSAHIRSKISYAITEGKSVALISDAGTPLISDPGYKLIKELQLQGCYVTSCPGPCSAINALVLSGLPTDKFLFEGFLPLKHKDRKQKFADIKQSAATTIIFDTSKKILATLEDLSEFFGDIEIVLLREMTKKFEERISGTISYITTLCQESAIRGELILIIPPQNIPQDLEAIEHDIKTLQQDDTNSAKDIVKIISFKYQNISRKTLYDMIVTNKQLKPEYIKPH